MPAAEPAGKPLPRSLAGALLHPWTWRTAWRDSRTQRGRLALIGLSIVIGLAALVAIHSLKSSLEKAIDNEAKSLLGSDLQITSRKNFQPDAVEKIRARAGGTLTRESSFASMAHFPSVDAARLVQVRALDGPYPFYGNVITEPPEAWAELQNKRGVLLEPALLDQFGVKIGDTVRLGGQDFPIAGTLTKGPPKSGRFSGLAPEAYVRMGDLASTGLLGTNSLATHHLHLKLPAGVNGKPLGEALSKEWNSPGWKFETPEDRRDTLADALDNMQRFLGIVAMTALVLGAIGVAGAAHSHITRRAGSIAILRCLGCSADAALAVYLVQTIVLGIAGSVLGSLLGVGLHLGTLLFFRDDLPVAIPVEPQWMVLLQAGAVGFLVCCAFSILPVLRVRSVPPAAALRDQPEFEKRPLFTAGTVLGTLAIGVALYLLAYLNTGQQGRALGLLVALAVALLVLAGTARLLVFLARRLLRPTLPYLFRQGISNLHRPHNQTGLFLFSLGLGTFLLLTVLLSRNLILDKLKIAEGNDGPNVYLVDVQPDQRLKVSEVLQAKNLPKLQSAPMVTMRLTAVKGVPVEQLQKEKKVPEWVLQREFRSTFRDHLVDTETLLSGEFTSKAGEMAVSLEQDIAKDLHVKVGDDLLLDVQGVPMTVKVTSIRKVDWSRFSLNFFMVFPPGVIDDAPGFHVVTTRIPDGETSGDLQKSLAKEVPNVTTIDLTTILATVRSIVNRITQAVQVLGGFTLVSGILILAGAIMNGRDQRIRESALLRTLGASRRQVTIILLVEYAALGLFSACTGILLAVAANVAMAKFVFKASPMPDVWLLLAAGIGATALSRAAGSFLGRGVCNHPPLPILRGSQG